MLGVGNLFPFRSETVSKVSEQGSEIMKKEF